MFAIALLAFVVLGLGYFIYRENKIAIEVDNSDAIAGQTHVRICNADDKAEAIEHFPYTLEEADQMMYASAEERENEAASLAMFTMYAHLEKMTPASSITVWSQNLGSYRFLPDFEGDHIVGLKPSIGTH